MEPDSLKNYNIPERLQYWAKIQPNSEAFVFVDKDGLRTSLTCKEILDQSVYFARHLRKLDIQPGEVICSLLPDSPNGIIVFFGTILAGCVFLNGKLQLKDGSFLIQNINKTKSPILILSSDPKDECKKLISELIDNGTGNSVSSKTLPFLNRVLYTEVKEKIGFKWANQLLENDDVDDDVICYDGNADAVILLSSGTTGMSKMIVHNHSVLKSFLEPIQPKCRNGSLNCYSLSWLPGFPHQYLYTGLKSVRIDNRNPPLISSIGQFIFDLLSQEKCDLFLIENLFLDEFLKVLETKGRPKEWPEHIECILTGRPIYSNVVDWLRTHFNVIYNIYGTTETCNVTYKKISKNTPYEDFNTGVARSGLDIIIRDENGAPVPPGTIGNIHVKTKMIMKRYFGDEKMTKDAFDSDGFLIMNDSGFFNKNGDLIVFGRIKDVIIRGDDCFHPAWIEQVIRRCPEVLDVMVVNVPDAMFDQEICACVVLIPGSKYTVEQIEEFCRDSFVTADLEHVIACPRYYILMDKIPVNAHDKPNRKGMAKYAEHFLNL